MRNLHQSRNLHLEMKAGNLPNPYEIQNEDVGHLIDFSFGRVLLCDVGKRIYYLKERDIIQQENDEQVNKRKGEPYIYG